MCEIPNQFFCKLFWAIDCLSFLRCSICVSILSSLMDSKFTCFFLQKNICMLKQKTIKKFFIDRLLWHKIHISLWGQPRLKIPILLNHKYVYVYINIYTCYSNYLFIIAAILDAASSVDCKSICSFCSRMKRGRLYAAARREGYNVLALGQHLDDLAESFLMSTFHNGRLRSMKAHYYIR